ncbi:DNA polymerase III subunit alpha [Candidatus Peregrinibacteria bacterium CG08_land_8_20_14_0_20_41_10]|nr:MAG: DNA polymerase III subunit alpha [Candidatus Peregrinibacteria bacterium CG08_land_8_20_14_0_20_41_10]
MSIVTSMSTPFVHLHNHSYYSLLDGLANPAALAKKARAQESPALALTDHGVMYGVIEFYKACKKEGINPVLGCEFYLTPYSRFEKRPQIDTIRYHLILLAENQIGYENLLFLTTKAHLEGMYYRPRIDWELLKEHHQGIIALSACIAGEIPRAITSGKKDEEILELIHKYQNTFGTENFFLELQDHPNVGELKQVNQKFIELGQRFHIPLVVTNDTHYLNLDDREAEEILLSVQTGKDYEDTERMSMRDGDYSLRPYEELRQAFPNLPEAFTNTVEIAKRCKVEFSFGRFLIPPFKISPEELANNVWTSTELAELSAEEYFLRKLCFSGLKRYRLTLTKEEIETCIQKQKDQGLTKKLQETSPEEIKQLAEQSYTKLKRELLQKLSTEHQKVIERLEYELRLIHEMGYDTYFLIVQDFVNWAKQQGIFVGPGRGSATGTVVGYTLNIFGVDPIKYNLIFERFLNPARVSPPDIDLDFEDTRREEVLEYVRQKYGEEHVAHICTFGTMAAKQAVKDVGRTLGLPFSEMNELAKFIPEKPGITLEDALETQTEFNKLYQSNPLYKKIVDLAKHLEGVKRHISVHACAVVITDKPLIQHTALQYAPKGQKEVITQLSMKPLDDLGILKIDFLGLRNLSILKIALEIIKRTKGIALDLDQLPMEDAKTFQLFQRAETTGVFQFESSGMKRYLKQLRPTEFEDLVAMAAMYRPGPIEWIPNYITGKRNPEKVTYPHPALEPILKITYGIAVYQEQALQIAQKFAGFSLGHADILRRAIGKKIAEEMAAQREKFIKGATLQGHTAQEGEFIFDKVITPFAGYGFNRSHAVPYALIGYQTAYLKANYATEFMTALLACDEDTPDRVIIDINECEAMGIEILPPDAQESLKHFTTVSENKIRFGLKAIKNLGDFPTETILKARAEGGSFKSLTDFCKRVPAEALNKKSLEALAFSGALDSLGERLQIAKNVDRLVAFAQSIQKSQQDNQTNLFGALGTSGEQFENLTLTPMLAATFLEKLRFEKQLLGLYVSGHPLDGLKNYFRKKAFLVEKMESKLEGKKIIVMGLVAKIKKIITKSKELMCYLTLEDPTGTIEVILFPRVYAQLGFVAKEDDLLIVEGRLDWRNENFQISGETIRKLDLEDVRARAKLEGLFEEKFKVNRLKQIGPATTNPKSENTETDEMPENVQSSSFEPAIETIIDPSQTKLFQTKEVVEDYFITLPQHCDKEKLLVLREKLQSQPQGNTRVVLQMNGEQVETGLKVEMNENLKKEVDVLVN